MIWNKEKIITFSFASRNVFFEKPDRFVNYTTNTVEKDLDLFVYRKTTIDVGWKIFLLGRISMQKQKVFLSRNGKNFFNFPQRNSSFELPWQQRTRNQTRANTTQEKQKEAAKPRSVQDQERSIIEVKKSFRYLQYAQLKPHNPFRDKKLLDVSAISNIIL